MVLDGFWVYALDGTDIDPSFISQQEGIMMRGGESGAKAGRMLSTLPRLENARITITPIQGTSGRRQWGMTDDWGSYCFGNVHHGVHEILVEHEGFASRRHVYEIWGESEVQLFMVVLQHGWTLKKKSRLGKDEKPTSY